MKIVLAEFKQVGSDGRLNVEKIFTICIIVPKKNDDEGLYSQSPSKFGSDVRNNQQRESYTADESKIHDLLEACPTLESWMKCCL